MTLYTPPREAPLESPLVPILGGAFMAAVLLGVWLFVGWAFGREPYDTTLFCEGYEVGADWGWERNGIDPSTVPPDVMPSCPPLAATRGLEGEASWCEGFSQGLLQVSLDLHPNEEPPEGRLEFVNIVSAACMEAKHDEQEESPPPMGGGGPNPRRN